jgi:hypothetical protein
MVDLSETKAREEKRAMAPLKEKISHFLYRQFIDFERDFGVIIEDQELYPAFFIPKFEDIIDCFISAKAGNPDYDKKLALYTKDGVKFLMTDITMVKEIDDMLEEKLPKLGVHLERAPGGKF